MQLNRKRAATIAIVCRQLRLGDLRNGHHRRAPLLAEDQALSANRLRSRAMLAVIWIVLIVLALPFKSKSRLEAENAILRFRCTVALS